MTNISYAQNFEDVMLWRALGGVANGFWIDAGAADPDINSVTRMFSDRGWHGVNIEPTPAFFARLVAARPRDINLNVALGAAPGQMIFYECAEAAISSLDPGLAERNRADGFVVTERTVAVMTLAQVCQQHAPRDIHFLKIDVEGAEAQVLAGADLKRPGPGSSSSRRRCRARRPTLPPPGNPPCSPPAIASPGSTASTGSTSRTSGGAIWAAISARPPTYSTISSSTDPADRTHAELAFANARLAALRAEVEALRARRVLRALLWRAARRAGRMVRG